MSVEGEDTQGIDQRMDSGYRTEKKNVVSYTREFLLSLSDLDFCKRLPSGFDESLLSEFEDTSQDRFRVSGSLSAQNFRHNEYGSSPPTRGDGSSYSRGIHTRWDSRSSGRSDRDSDSQSDREPDSGRRYGNQSRRPWQSTEHDGLLGSGSFPRPSGYATGISVPKFRANDQYQLNRSNEPYHPPRPYKAVPYLHRETKDSFNDETFGSSEVANEDRAEEERKRREEFELMRKEQHKAFQEKKFDPEKRKDGFDITELLDGSKDDNRVKRSNSDEQVMLPSISSSSVDKSSLIMSAPVSRPLVPPGFSGTVVEKNTCTHSSSQSLLSEVGDELLIKGNISRSGESIKKEEKLPLEQMDFSKQFGSSSITNLVDNKSEMVQKFSPDMDVERRTISLDVPIHKSSKISESLEPLPSVEKLDFGTKDMTGSKVVGESAPARSTSILDKLFGSALTLNDGDSSNFIERDDVKTDETWSSHSVQSSKFAQWFPEEEKKPDNDLSNLSSGKLDDFLSLFVGGEKAGSQALDAKANKPIPLSIPLQNSEVWGRLVNFDFTHSNADKNEQMHKTDKLEAVSAVQSVLTCENLEQSILLEATENDSAVSPSLLQWSGHNIKTEQKADAIDNHASLHILSLLQKGTGPNDLAAFANLGSGSLDTKQHTEVANRGPTINNSIGVELKDELDSGKPLTLETLFGTAFMKELQPTGGSVSGQRGSIAGADASESHGLRFREVDDGILTSDVASNISNHGSGMLVANQRQQRAPDRIEEHFVGFVPLDRVDSSQLQTELGLKLGGTGSTEIGLPEDGSFLAVSGPMNLQNFISARNSTKLDLTSASEAPVDISGKLAALNSVLRDERTIIRGQEGPPFHHGPYETKEPDIRYHNIHAQSSPQLHPSQSNHVGPVLQPLDAQPANINARMKFMNPENIHHDASSLQFQGNALQPRFHHPSSGIGGSDPDMHSSMLHQIPRHGNSYPSHLLPGFPRGASHPSNNVIGYMQNNTMQGFPFGQRQPHFGGVGIPPPASEVGNGTNNVGAYQFIEMEPRSNPKQIQPFGASGQSRGMFGHKLDTGFGFI